MNGIAKIHSENAISWFIYLITTVAFTMASSFSIRAETIEYEDAWDQAGFNLVDQSPSGVEIIFALPGFRITPVYVDGETMQSITIPGVALSRNAGAPNLPNMSRFIAIPEGASVAVEIVQSRIELLQNMKIAPAPRIKFVTDDSPNEYKRDPAIYSRNCFFPAEPVITSEPREIRGVDIVILSISPFQYNPVSGELLIYRDLRIKVDFKGGSGHFGEDRLRNRYWEPILAGNLLNYSSLPEVNFNRIRPTDDEDVEYLIIVPDDPVFIAWADSLKRWRNEQGIITGITTVTEIGGNDASLIENYINNAYNTWLIPPVAVLLLSDYQSSGDPYGISSPIWNGAFVSDNVYADVDGDDLPDLVVARMTAQNSSDVEQMITKQLEYERNPPTDPGFYRHPALSGGWLEPSWFILDCETLWGYLHNVCGKDPMREYAIISGIPGLVWSTAPFTQEWVDYFGPNGLGYIPENPSYLTDWGGSAARLNNDVNQGCFLLLHRDHGTVTGWGTPSYSINDLNGLNNDEYPYVLSMDCLTGKFNGAATCFVEAMHRMQHGALGLLAATDITYSFLTDLFFWGVCDALWSDFMPDFPSDPFGDTQLMPGFANVSAKYFLEIFGWPYNPQQKATTYHLFHHFGDAFLTLYTELPQTLSVEHADHIEPNATEFTVIANEGAMICLSSDGEIIGTAQATGAPVVVPISPVSVGDTVRVTVTKANYIRYIADVPVVDVVSITLIPFVTPIIIPASGGSFDYSIAVANNPSSPTSCDVWCDITLPGGAHYGPVIGPVALNLPPGFNNGRDRTQQVPGAAPAGTYYMNAYIGDYPGEVSDFDFFPFEKLASRDEMSSEGWDNRGESFEEWKVAMDANVTTPDEFELYQNHPNPFNPITIVSYTLPVTSRVEVGVYDLSGRLVARLVDDWREAGTHEVFFDGSNLTSGIYLARLIVGDYTTVRKMILIK